MALKIDSPTLESWKAAGVRSVIVRFVTGGCAGTKISVEKEPENISGLRFVDLGGIVAYFDDADAPRLDGARITRTEKNGKETWIFSGPEVKGRCGCGSSFSFEKSDKPALGHADLEKLAGLKARFSSPKGA